VQHKGGAILLYNSSDLRHWTYLHPLLEGSSANAMSVNPVDSGEMWECPDFFPLGGKHVLLISTMGKVRWKVGAYVNRRFTPEKEGVVDWGAYYAAKTMVDASGERILWGWITETRPDADLIATGWAGVMSLPRILSLNSENELQMDVAPAAHQLRAAHTSISRDATGATLQKQLDDLRLRDLAVELIFEVRSRADEFAIHLQSENGDKFVTISCTNKSGSRELRVDTVSAPIAGELRSPVRLHIYLDGSVLEIFANETTSLTKRIYQIPSGPLTVKLEGAAELTLLEAWQMNPISKDRLTGT
jgi:beta-fructofuranosidase